MMTPSLPDAIGPLLEFLNFAGIALMAASGAVLAAEKQRDFISFVFFAGATGIGGGTVRDVLLGIPVFWMRENVTLLICLGAALGVWFTPVRFWKGTALLWLDAVGLAAFATYGAAKALAFGVDPLPAFAMGVFTSCLGGIIRDMLANEPSILLRPELYVTAAALSAGLAVLLLTLGLPPYVAGIVGTLAGMGLRGGAILKGWELPTYKR
jgi:uncharacterized membrane protein YeiH